MAPDDQRLSPAMRLALKDTVPNVTAGDFEWKQIDQGFESTEMPVLSNGSEIDRIFLAGVDTVLVWRDHFVAIHARLHRTDRIDLRNLYDHSFLT